MMLGANRSGQLLRCQRAGKAHASKYQGRGAIVASMWRAVRQHFFFLVVGGARETIDRARWTINKARKQKQKMAMRYPERA